MLTDIPGIAVFLALIALAPGVASWWHGRRLVRFIDDPALPERLHAARRRNGAIVGFALMLLIAFSPEACPWTIPLLFFSLITGGYPLRKALFDETWGVVTYVWFITRLFVGVWGFWLFLPTLPLIAVYGGSRDWLVSLVFAGLLVVWNAWYAEILRFFLRTRPVEDPALLARFTAMVHTAGIPMPRFERVDLHGGVIANALALPSLKGSSVLFSETLLERLEADEIVAICAHELAHLEYFNTALLRRLNRINLLLIASGAAIAPVTRFAHLPSSLILTLVWLLGVLGALLWRARDRQRNETTSDLRSVALCGDGEALVRGLTRLYAMARVPRRMDVQLEQRATHPSLARRIRDIRAAAGTAVASLETAASFTATNGAVVVTFEHDTLQWSERDAAVHRLSYAHLSELRLQVKGTSGTNPASLVAVERQGRRWEMPLSSADVARAQAVLDIVDARLPPPPPSPPAIVWPKIDRTVLAFVGLIGLMLGQVAVALVSLLALLQPTAPIVAAAGIASLTAAAMLMRTGGFMTELALMLGVAGIALLVVARWTREDKTPRRAALPAALLGALAVLSVGIMTMSGVDPVRIHQSARSATAAPVFLLAFAGALAVWRSRTVQYAAIPVIMIAAATSVAASSSFLDRFGRDPFLVPAAPFNWKTIEGRTVAEFSVPFTATSLQLSPTGRSVAIVSNADRYDEDAPSTFHIGRPGRTLTSVTAQVLVFIDDERILIARTMGDDVQLRQMNVESPERASWSAVLRDVSVTDLAVNGITGRWRVMGWDQTRRVVRLEGVLGAPGVQRYEWPAEPSTSGGWISSFSSSGSAAVLAHTQYRQGFLQRCGLWRVAWMFEPDVETRFLVAKDGTVAEVAASQLNAQCRTARGGHDGLICNAYDGSRTRFISVDAVSRDVQGLAWLTGRFYANPSPSGAWVSGWHDNSAVALNLESREALRAGAGGPDRIFHIAVADGVVGILAYTGSPGIRVSLKSLANP